jgi:hypothetical protein
MAAMRRPPLLPLLALFLALARPVAADESEVSGARALETVKVLSGDDFGGRKSGLESGRKAEEYMGKQLEAIGLKPGYKGTYFHTFKASVTEDLPGAVFVVRGGKRPEREGKFLADYVSLIYSGQGEVESDVVFVGYGIHAPDRGRDDYEGFDVNGKVVMALRGLPPNSGFDDERMIGYKSSVARDRGAKGFLLVEGDRAVAGTIQEKYHRSDLPAAWISRKAADDLFARAGKPNLAQQVKALQAGEKRSFALDGVKVKLRINARLLKDQPMRNVVGLWPGTGDEYVVLGAHLDHVGTDAAGNVYNGADDNASGSAMLLEVARAMVASGTRFRRSILFCWFAAEEQGLTGSRRLVQETPVPLDKIALMVNADMVGQGKPELGMGGGELFPRDAGMLAGLAVEGFSLRIHRSGPNSDHHPFQDAGVPAFFMHTVGPHPNYHRPADDWERIKPELLEVSGRYLRALAERAADSDQPHCRPNRLGEYLWHLSRVVDLSGARGVGIDFGVDWIDGDVETVMNRLAQDRDEKVERTYQPGANVDGLANDLKPTRLLGVKGYAAYRLHRPARKLGAVLFAPFLGSAPAKSAKDIEDLGKQNVLLWLEGAPDDTVLLNYRATLLVPLERALAWEGMLKKRVHPWLAVAGGSDVKEILDARKRLGARRVVVSPGGPGLARDLMVGTLDRRAVRQLLGGNFVAALRRVR